MQVTCITGIFVTVSTQHSVQGRYRWPFWSEYSCSPYCAGHRQAPHSPQSWPAAGWPWSAPYSALRPHLQGGHSDRTTGDITSHGDKRAKWMSSPFNNTKIVPSKAILVIEIYLLLLNTPPLSSCPFFVFCSLGHLPPASCHPARKRQYKIHWLISPSFTSQSKVMASEGYP